MRVAEEMRSTRFAPQAAHATYTITPSEVVWRDRVIHPCSCTSAAVGDAGIVVGAGVWTGVVVVLMFPG